LGKLYPSPGLKDNILRASKFSQWSCWKIQSSGILCLRIHTSKYPSALISRSSSPRRLFALRNMVMLCRCGWLD